MVEHIEFDFERLKVYQKALSFIHETMLIYNDLSQGLQICLGSNLVRAAMSIANNIAEGSGKISKKEKARYYGTSLDSARECISVFNVLYKEKLIKEDEFRQRRVEGKEITSMLFKLIQAIEK